MQNKSILKLVKSSSFNPWYNLSLEEHLFNNTKEDEVTLYLWQNDKTIVIGRNQNPWKECRYKELEHDDGKLARRLSGGGAVYHDLGNLNFTFIAKENLFNIKKHLQVIIEAVEFFGIKVVFSGRNDLLAEGRKISGNAFYSDEGNCYHHGTLLVSSDINKLGRYLQVSKEKIKSKGIDSVEARVVNLNTIDSCINITNLSESLEKSFQNVYSNKISEKKLFNGDTSEFEKLYTKYSSWEWRFGETPNFEINLNHRFLWGDLDINLNLKDGFIGHAVIFSDSLDIKLIRDMVRALKNQKFTKQVIVKRINDLKTLYDVKVIEEIKSWILNQDI